MKNVFAIFSIKSNQVKHFWFGLLFISTQFLSCAFCLEKQDFSAIVEQVGPSVVNVIAVPQYEEKKLVSDELRAQLEGTPLMDVLRQLYGDRLDEKLSGKSTSLGSGFLISPDGYIVTNDHVIEEAKTVYVILQDRRQFEAKVIGLDPGTDLALLKIDENNLPYITLDENVVPKVGEWALAIGEPFGFENSVTVGVVSAMGRNLGSTERYASFIQTDAAVNPGNSGGPLLNAKGELIGVNSQIVSQSGDYAGLSFAVPVKIVKYVIEKLKNKGKVERGWMGVAFQDVDANLADAFGLPKMKGALISRVFPLGPAAKAGVQIGDIIVSINGKEIIRSTDIPPILGIIPVGSKINLEMIRDRKEKNIELVLQEYVPTKILATRDEKAIIRTAIDSVRAGITVRDLEDFEQVKLEPGTIGILVVAVESPVWTSAGIMKGDRILSVDNQPIQHATEFYSLIQSSLQRKITKIPILIAREGEIQRYVVVKFE